MDGEATDAGKAGKGGGVDQEALEEDPAKGTVNADCSFSGRYRLPYGPTPDRTRPMLLSDSTFYFRT